jgi:hypothetical protein
MSRLEIEDMSSYYDYLKTSNLENISNAS